MIITFVIISCKRTFTDNGTIDRYYTRGPD